MIPHALLFSRYRAFRNHTRLQLAPLTLVIGKNGGGKSVLTRLPLLLASGLQADADAPLDLTAGDIRHATRFEDLIYQRSAQPFSLGAEIGDDERSLRFVTTLIHVVERHTIAVAGFELFENDRRIVKLDAAPEDIGQREGRFTAFFGEESTGSTVQVQLVGLFPVSIDGHNRVSNAVQTAREHFRNAFAAPSYLGPFRSEEGSLPRVPKQGVRSLGSRGERALDMLGDDDLRGDGSLVRAVENWFEESMGDRLKLERFGDLPRLKVRDRLRETDVDISDTGAGFAQVFPVVVQSLARRMGRMSNTFMIIEQPELHLHPGAHGCVADLIASAVAECRADVRCICETHSEQVVTRIRRRIAEGQFPAEMVQIASVGHQSVPEDTPEALRMISIDSMGNPESWPVGVFDEAFEDVVRLREAAQRRLDEEPSDRA